MISVLAGGVGAARLLQGLVQVVNPKDVIVIANTADDVILHGLHVSPDIDTLTYTLAGVNNKETGWGREDETWLAMDSLKDLGRETWFRLGDRDLATHMYRTGRIAEGAGLAEVTAEISASFGLEMCFLPMTEDSVQTKVTLADGSEVGFQEYFVKLAHNVPISKIRLEGIGRSQPGPGVLDAIDQADVLVIAPSNPFASIDPILAIPGIESTVRSHRQKTVAISPIVGGTAIKGPAHRMFKELGHESSVVGVAHHYRNLASTLVIDKIDAELANAVEDEGLRCVVTETVMRDTKIAAALAKTALETVL